MMYFGTKDNMRWVKSPAINTPLGLNTQTDSGMDVNGGGYVLNGGASHKVYDFSWGASPASDVYAITDYASGDFGRGPIYFLDEFARTTNVFPQDFTSPANMWRTGRISTNAPAPTYPDKLRTPTTTELNLPGIVWYSPGSSAGMVQTDSVYIPVPPGYALWVAYVAGTSAGSLQRQYVDEITGEILWGEVSATPVSTLTDSYVPPTAWEWYYQGNKNTTYRWELGNAVGGVCGALVGVVLPSGQTPSPTHQWTPGKGNGGCKFDGPPTITGISAALMNSVSATARLREVF